MCPIFPSYCSALELAELIVERHLRVDPVQLQQVDPLHSEKTQAQLGLLAEVFRPADRHPLPRPLTGEADFRGDDEVVRVRVQRLRISGSVTDGP